MLLNLQSVLRHGSALQRSTSLRELVQATYDAVRSETRYRTTWLAVIRPEEPDWFYIVQAEGIAPEVILERCPRVPIVGDPLMEELREGRSPLVVDDCRLDPRTNKALVNALGNRTLINIPLVLGEDLVGALGLGTFGEEGVLPPTDQELEMLVVFSTQLAGAITRMRLVEDRQRDAAARLTLERSLESLQRVELMGVLAAGVAHDLNNYLTVVSANLESLRLVAPEESRAELDDALLATERSVLVVRQLLALGRSRSEAREVLDLGVRVSSTLNLVRGAIPRSVAVTHRVGAPAMVEADPVQVEQALANLLLNARDAVGGAGAIDVEVGEWDLDEAYAHRWTGARAGRFGRVLVHDTGPGIAPDVLPHIFDPLYSTKRTGTGLGLAVVSRVAQQHGGFVTCESVPGHGATFALCLPLAARRFGAAAPAG